MNKENGGKKSSNNKFKNTSYTESTHRVSPQNKTLTNFTKSHVLQARPSAGK